MVVEQEQQRQRLVSLGVQPLSSFPACWLEQPRRPRCRPWAPHPLHRQPAEDPACRRRHPSPNQSRAPRPTRLRPAVGRSCRRPTRTRQPCRQPVLVEQVQTPKLWVQVRVLMLQQVLEEEQQGKWELVVAEPRQEQRPRQELRPEVER